MEYGILSLLPIVVVMLLAVKSKRSLEPLIAGTLVAYLITDQENFFDKWCESIFLVVTNYDHQWVFMVCCLFGSLIALISSSRGALEFSKKLEFFCRGPKSTMIITWIMGILIFIDDYLNIMTLSTCMKKMTDKKRIPRESLSYVIDSTGAPVCALLPFSTWAVFFATLFYAQPGIKELGFGSAAETFYHVIPYTFYALLAVIIVPLFILGAVPKIGKMREAYERVAKNGQVYSDDSKDLNKDSDDDNDNDISTKGSMWDFVLPVSVLIISAVVTGNLFKSVLYSIAVCFILYIPRKKVTLGEFFDLFMHGFCNMIPTVAIIFFAFVMQSAMTEIDIAGYVINTVEPYMNAVIFPAAVFIIVAILNFSTGSVWGIPAIVSSIIIPLGFSIGADAVLVMGAIVSGATLGSHACFYSDATVLTSSCCKMKNMDHALSQFPYAMLAAFFSTIGYLTCGFIM